MVAIHHFHNAVEIVLRTIILDNRLKPETQLRNANFEAMTNWVFDYADEKGVTLSHREHVTALADRRNAVQHRGDVIAAEALDDSRIDCYRFLREAFRGYFGVEFDDFRVYDVVENEYVRKLLSTAEEDMQRGKYAQAIAACKLIVRLAGEATDELRVVPQREDLRLRAGSDPLARAFDKIAAKLLFWIKQVDSTAVLAFLGTDVTATRKFLRLGIRVYDSTTFSSKERRFDFRKLKGTAFDEEDARQALDYAFQAALRVQEVGLISGMTLQFDQPEAHYMPQWERFEWEPPPEITRD